MTTSLLSFVIAMLFLLYFLFLNLTLDIHLYRILWLLPVGYVVLNGMRMEWLQGILLVIMIGLCLGMILLEIGNQRTAKEGRIEEPDILVLLGCKVGSLAMRYRSEAANAYAKKHKVTAIITTGGQGSNEPCTEAEDAKRHLLRNGIEEEKILLEDTSVSTRENLEKSEHLYHIKDKHVGIVTSAYHVCRSIYIAKSCGYTHVYGIPSRINPIYYPDSLLRELLAFLKEYLLHH